MIEIDLTLVCRSPGRSAYPPSSPAAESGVGGQWSQASPRERRRQTDLHPVLRQVLSHLFAVWDRVLPLMEAIKPGGNHQNEGGHGGCQRFS